MNTARPIRGALLVIGAALVAAGVQPPAQADDQFGQHVRTCAQVMGFDGDHNPGMHHGYAGWSPDHEC